MVSPEMAQDRKWWHDERYAIYDLNVNSAAAYPQHEEELDLSTAGPIYTAKGYAYAGSGRRITRVEISLDKGKCKFFRQASIASTENSHVWFTAWRLADIEYAEDRYRDFEGDLFGGKVDMWQRETCFCWSFWSLNIPVADLEGSEAILVRAMDEALTAQPRDMYWSVLGMMNNPWFRITITKEGNRLKFEHPTHPAKAGGWMEKNKKAGGDLLNGNWGERIEGETPVEPEPVKEINMKKEGVSRQIDLAELKANSSAEKPWFVVNGEVYDGTGFLEGHPGGAISITSSAGLDVSEDFLAIREYLPHHTLDTQISNTCYRQRNGKDDDARLSYRHIGQGVSRGTREQRRPNLHRAAPCLPAIASMEQNEAIREEERVLGYTNLCLRPRTRETVSGPADRSTPDDQSTGSSKEQRDSPAILHSNLRHEHGRENGAVGENLLPKRKCSRREDDHGSRQTTSRRGNRLQGPDWPIRVSRKWSSPNQR